MQGACRFSRSWVLFVFVRDMLSYFFRATQRTKVIFQAFVVSSVVMLLAIPPP